jgi:hypothetical protein
MKARLRVHALLFHIQILYVTLFAVTLPFPNQSATTHRSLLASGSFLPAAVVPQPQPPAVVALLVQVVSWKPSVHLKSGNLAACMLIQYIGKWMMDRDFWVEMKYVSTSFCS